MAAFPAVILALAVSVRQPLASAITASGSWPSAAHRAYWPLLVVVSVQLEVFPVTSTVAPDSGLVVPSQASPVTVPVVSPQVAGGVTVRVTATGSPVTW